MNLGIVAADFLFDSSGNDLGWIDFSTSVGLLDCENSLVTEPILGFCSQIPELPQSLVSLCTTPLNNAIATGQTLDLAYQTDYTYQDWLDTIARGTVTNLLLHEVAHAKAVMGQGEDDIFGAYNFLQFSMKMLTPLEWNSRRHSGRCLYDGLDECCGTRSIKSRPRCKELR